MTDVTPTPKTPSKLLKSGSIFASMTLISRVLGFLRDMVIARVFGVTASTDAFFVAFKIPNFLRRLFAEGAFSQAFVPVFTEYKTKRSFAELKALLNAVSGTLAGVLIIITTIGVSTAPLLVLIFAPGFSDNQEQYQLAGSMLRITFPYLLFISLTALAAGVLNSFGRFAGPAITPIFLNLSLIACAFWLSPMLDEPIIGLAWGVFIAGIVQLLFQIPFLQQIKMLPKPKWRWQDSGVQKIIRLMIPAIFGSAVVQINLLLDTLIASFLMAGSVSWLYYSDRLVEFPLGVFGIALATVILPNLSKHHSEASNEAFSNTLDWALRLTLLIGLPAMLGLALLAKPMLQTLFQYGEFSELDSTMASYSLIAYACGLPAFILIKVLASGFYSRQDTKTPVKTGIIAMCINMALNIVFVVTMIQLEFLAPHTGLALATSSSAWCQALILYSKLRKQNVYRPLPGWRLLFLQVLIALVAMSALILYYQPLMDFWAHALAWERALKLTLLVIGGAIGYGLVLLLCGVRYQHFRHNDQASEP